MGDIKRCDVVYKGNSFRVRLPNGEFIPHEFECTINSTAGSRIIGTMSFEVGKIIIEE